VWRAGIGPIRASTPLPFVKMPITYDRAFGGVDQRHDDPAKHDAYMRNPVGRGFHKHVRSDWVDGAPMPNTEQINQPVTTPDGYYTPMSFGPVGRGWEPRYKFAGTYDDKWLADEFPFLPSDFNEEYFQAAPVEQQLPLPLEGPDVALLNLTPDGRRQFKLPNFQAPIYVFPKKGEREDLMATWDTIVLEPDQERFMLTWRVARPLKKSMHEVSQVLIGRKSELWWQAQAEKREATTIVPFTEDD
jgi:hypothetical protein